MAEVQGAHSRRGHTFTNSTLHSPDVMSAGFNNGPRLSISNERAPPDQQTASGNPKPGELNDSSFRFVVVEHPDQLRDRRELRENRMHVMRDYLAKERKRPESRDVRVTGPKVSSRKRRSPPGEAVHGQSVDEATSRLLEEDRAVGGSHSVHGVKQQPGHGRAQRARPSIRQIYHPNEHGQRLVSGIGGRFANSAYMSLALDEVPALGASLEPFGTWPCLNDPSLDVNALKWSCFQHFGSESLGAHWIPALLRTRHAFLSTLCISSAHDAIMTRALVPSHPQTAYKSIRRWKVKREVVSMVASCLDDPLMQTSDETIIAVVHLLNSDIMGCDDRDMRVHQDGLLQMVCQRGGLRQLGLEGQLAGVLTITNYLIAALREMTPHKDYLDFASQANANWPRVDTPLPESPVYSRPSGFQTIQRELSPESETYQLLDCLRTFTNRVYLENGPRATEQADRERQYESCPESAPGTAELSIKIHSFRPAKEQDFHDMNERHTYEAIRLAGIVYTHALSNGIPFSKAAEDLRRMECRSSSRARTRGSGASRDDDAAPTLAMQLRHALLRTDVSFCWDHLGGVLFWITIVGGAAANPGPYANEARGGDAEDARKFLAALAVRCCLVLSFQYGSAVLETLKRVVMMQAILEAPTGGDRGTAPEGSGLVGPTQPGGSCVFGPSQPSHLQDGFASIAQHLWSS